MGEIGRQAKKHQEIWAECFCYALSFMLFIQVSTQVNLPTDLNFWCFTFNRPPDCCGQSLPHYFLVLKFSVFTVGCALSNIHLLLLLRDPYSSDCSSGDTDSNVILSGEYLASLLSYGNVYCKIPFSSLLHRNEVKSQGKNLTWEVRALHFFLGLIQIVAANTWA